MILTAILCVYVGVAVLGFLSYVQGVSYNDTFFGSYQTRIKRHLTKIGCIGGVLAFLVLFLTKVLNALFIGNAPEESRDIHPLRQYVGFGGEYTYHYTFSWIALFLLFLSLLLLTLRYFIEDVSDKIAGWMVLGSLLLSSIILVLFVWWPNTDAENWRYFSDLGFIAQLTFILFFATVVFMVVITLKSPIWLAYAAGLLLVSDVAGMVVESPRPYTLLYRAFEMDKFSFEELAYVAASSDKQKALRDIRGKSLEQSPTKRVVPVRGASEAEHESATPRADKREEAIRAHVKELIRLDEEVDMKLAKELEDYHEKIVREEKEYWNKVRIEDPKNTTLERYDALLGYFESNSSAHMQEIANLANALGYHEGRVDEFANRLLNSCKGKEIFFVGFHPNWGDGLYVETLAIKPEGTTRNFVGYSRCIGMDWRWIAGIEPKPISASAGPAAQAREVASLQAQPKEPIQVPAEFSGGSSSGFCNWAASDSEKDRTSCERALGEWVSLFQTAKGAIESVPKWLGASDEDQVYQAVRGYAKPGQKFGVLRGQLVLFVGLDQEGIVEKLVRVPSDTHCIWLPKETIKPLDVIAAQSFPTPTARVGRNKPWALIECQG